MIPQIFDSINFYFYKLRLQIEDLQSYSYFTEDQYKLIFKLKKFNIKFQKKFLDTYEKVQEKLKSDISDEEIYEEINKKIPFYFHYLKLFNQYLEYIRTAQNVNINQGIYFLIEEFTKNVSEKSRFIIFPMFQTNCGYLDLSKKLNEFTRVLNKKDIKDFLLFQIPTFNQKEILNNSILGHEIGHYIEEKNSIRQRLIITLNKQKIITKDKIRHIAEARFEKEQKIEKDLEIDDVLLDCYDDWIEKKINPWIKEIISDLIGLRIFGLAYFFAFFDTISQTQAIGGREHPPTELRLNFLINDIKINLSHHLDNFTLKINNSKGELVELGSELKSMINIVENERIKEFKGYQNPINEVTSEIFKNLKFSDELYKVIDELTEKNILKQYNFSNQENVIEIVYLIKLLEEYIIPCENESLKPVNIISIINAGWIFYLFKMNEHYKRFGVEVDDLTYEMTDKKMLVNQKLQNLLLKAIELSKIKEQLQNRIAGE